MKPILLAVLLFPFCACAQFFGDGVFLGAAASVVNPLQVGAWGYYKMDDATYWTNAISTSYTLNESNSVTAGAGEFIGNCGVFSTSWLQSANGSFFSALDNSLTICAWVKPSATNAAETIVSKGSSASNREYQLYWSNTRNAFAFNVITNGATSTVIQTTAGNIPLNTWYFVVGLIDTTNHIHRIRAGTGTTLGAWVDSAAWNGWGPDGHGTNTAIMFRIGAMVGDYWVGSLDEVGVWNRALSDAEITTLFNGGSGKTWPFD